MHVESRTGDELRLFQRQVQVTSRVAGLVQIAHIVSTVTLAIFAIPPSAHRFRIVWCTLMVATSLSAIAMCIPQSRRPAELVKSTDIVPVRAMILIQAVLYAWMGWRCVPIQEAGQRTLFFASLAGVLGAGTIAMSNIRNLALTWVWSVVGALAVSAAVHPTVTFTVLIAEMLLFGVALNIGVVVLSDSFAARCHAEFAAERDRQVIGLLLDDFEGGARDWLWESDDQGRLLHVSPRFAECAGRSRDSLHGLALTTVLRDAGAATGDDAGAALATIDARLNARQAFRDVVVPVVLGGERRWWSLSGNPNEDGITAERGWRGVGSDISDAVRQQSEILRLVNTDALTGVGNRRALSEHLDRVLTLCGPGQSVHVGLLDLDNFKSINDTLGHQVGDAVLRAMSARIEARLGPGEYAARMGGDEFAIVLTLPEITAAQRFDDLLDVLRAPFLVNGTHLELRGSLGYAAYPEDANTSEELLMVADLALYAAKDAGRDQVRRYDGRLREKAASRALALQELRHAIDHGELELHYQPQVSSVVRAVTGFEALVRWNHPTRGLVSPLEFITVAEETGLIVPLGEWIFAEACRTATTWPDDVRVSVNVSPVQLLSTGLVAGFTRILDETGLSSERVEIEITESGFVDDIATSAVNELADLGFSIAIDDFGTGYSSLSVLRTLPVTRVKIDRAFVKVLDEEAAPSAKHMLAAIVQIAVALGLDIIAEGVETEFQRALIAEVGCPQIQGFLESRPLRRDALGGYLSERINGVMCSDGADAQRRSTLTPATAASVRRAG